MPKKLLAKIKPFFKSLALVALVLLLSLGRADSAMAARSGGRIGGGSFRTAPMPTRTYAPPSGGYGGGYGYGYGGGIGFPFLMPFLGFGGFGSLFTILIFIAVANFLVNAVRNSGAGGEILNSGSSDVSIARVQVGLLADARELQTELNQLARSADTASEEGRAALLQEATLALLRHPEYWVYGAAEAQQAALASAEAKFNQYALGERSKFIEETLSNFNNQLRETPKAIASAEGSLSTEVRDEGRDYIVVTLVVGALNRLELPAINDTDDLRRTLRQIGSLGSDRLLAVEVLWTPQAEGDTLSTNDILAYYPNLKLV